MKYAQRTSKKQVKVCNRSKAFIWPKTSIQLSAAKQGRKKIPLLPPSIIIAILPLNSPSVALLFQNTLFILSPFVLIIHN